MTSVMRNIVVKKIKVSKALSKSGLPEYDYSLNPYIGCLHGCRYCYAIDFTRGDPASRWGEIVYVKINLPEILRKEVKIYRRGVVGISTITDPYQSIEYKYNITRRSLEILLENRFRVSIQTKSPLVLRDLDILERYKDLVEVGFTITTLDETKKRFIEPWTPGAESLVYALKRLSEKKISTWIFVGPIIPDVNDDINDLMRILDLARETGSEIIFDYFRSHVGSINMMRKYFDQSIIKKILSKDYLKWWNNLINILMKYCSEANIRCVTADEYWKNISRRRVGEEKDLLFFAEK
ncbi:MAG: radical SAM protein [Desulfurococcaceae archaeon]|nr:radical SAM protein [Desulfurococcaceae archaeon]